MRKAIEMDDGTNQMVTDRIRVPGGWLVRTRTYAITRPKNHGISGYDVHTIFIPYPDFNTSKQADINLAEQWDEEDKNGPVSTQTEKD